MIRAGVKWLGAALLLAAIVLLGLVAGQLHHWRTFMDQPATSRPVGARMPGTQLVVLGTTHAPQPNFTPDSLYTALEQLRPDVILFEIDSSRIDWIRQPPGLTQALATTLGGAAPENEGQAVRKYLRWHPATALQPYEWNRRDAFHRQYGILTEPGKVLARLAQLREAGQLLPWQLGTLVAYDSLNARLNALARQPLDSLNTPAGGAAAGHAVPRPGAGSSCPTGSGRVSGILPHQRSVLGHPQPGHGPQRGRLGSLVSGPAAGSTRGFQPPLLLAARAALPPGSIRG